MRARFAAKLAVAGAAVGMAFALGTGYETSGSAVAALRSAHSAGSAEAPLDNAAVTDAMRTVFLPNVDSSAAVLAIDEQIGGQVVALDVASGWLYLVQGDRLLVVDARDAAHPVALGSTTGLGCPPSGIAAADASVFVACRDELVAVEVSEPGRPIEIGRTPVPGHAKGLRVLDGLVVLAAGPAGVVTLDVSDPARPRVLGATEAIPAANDVAVRGHHAFVAAGRDVFAVVDISDPTRPRVVHGSFGNQGSTALTYEATSVDVTGDIAIVAQGMNERGVITGGVHLFDVSDPEQPVALTTFQPPEYPRTVRASGDLAILTHGAHGMSVIDISEPAAPRYALGDTSSAIQDVRLDGGLAYLASPDGVEVLDLSLMVSPRVAYTHTIEGFGGRCRRVAEQDGWLAAACDGGKVMLADVRDPASISVVGPVTVTGSALDVAWGAGALFVAGDTGVAAIDARRGETPAIVATHRTESPVQAIAADGPWVYAGSSAGDFWVLEARGPGELREVTRLALGSGVTAIEVEDRLAYVVNDGGDLRVIDVGAPEQPEEVGVFAVPSGYYVDEVAVVGRHAYVRLHESTQTSSRNWLGVVDLADPRSPRWVHGQRAYVSGLVAETGRLVATHGMSIFDLCDPTEPRPVGRHAGASRACALRDGRVSCFEPPERGAASISIIDVGGVVGPRRVGRIAVGTPIVAWDVAVADRELVVLDHAELYERHPWHPSGHLEIRAGDDAASLVSRTPLLLPDGGQGDPGRLRIEGPRAYVSAGRLLAVYGLATGSAPRLLGRYVTPSAFDEIGDFVTAGGHAYVMGGLRGWFLSTLDVSDATSITLRSSWRGSPDASPRAIAMAGGHLYVAGSILGSDRDDRVWAFDLTDPAHPEPAGEIRLASEPTDMLGVPGALVVAMSGGLHVFELSDPLVPREAAHVAVRGEIRLSAAGTNVYAYGDLPNEGNPFTTVVDLSTPGAPRRVGTLGLATRGAAAWGSETYLAAGGRGLVRLAPTRR